MGQLSLTVVLIVACLSSILALPRPRMGPKDIHIKRVKRDDGSQYLDVIDVTSEPNVKSPGMIDDVLMAGGLRDSGSSSGMTDNSYEQQQDDTDLGDIVANLPSAGDAEDDDVDLTLYPQGWNDQSVDDNEDGQVYERRKRNIVAALSLSQQQQQLHQHKINHSSKTARNKLQKARHPAQVAAALKNRTKRGAPVHSQAQQQSLSDEDLLNLILLADQLQARKQQQQYREQYTHQRRPMISDEDPLLTAALLAAQAEDEEGIFDGYQQEDDGEETYMPMGRSRSHLTPIYPPKVYPDNYGPMEFTENGYRRSGYRQAYLPGQKRTRNQDNDKLFAIAQMLGKPNDQQQKTAYRRQHA